MLLSTEVFQKVLENVPLVSIDFIVKKENKILLGKRVNKPACGYYFSIGGRIFKNETIQNAMQRIAKDELGLELNNQPNFIGIFEHFYEDGIFEGVSTHYINLVYEIEVSFINPPKEQHSGYRWFKKEELLQSSEVHKYTKDCFKIGEKENE